MTESRLDTNTRRLLRSELDSFEKLEIMRVLRAVGGTISHTQLAAECRFAADTVRDAAAELARAGLLELDDTGTVRQTARGRAPEVEALMVVYNDDRATVMATLSAIAMEKIRNMAARAFSSAFLLRKKRGDDDG